MRSCGFKSHLPHFDSLFVRILQEWRNWQTRRLQVPVVAISCGFKSHLLHVDRKSDKASYFLSFLTKIKEIGD